jgi:hypothetical protein
MSLAMTELRISSAIAPVIAGAIQLQVNSLRSSRFFAARKASNSAFSLS